MAYIPKRFSSRKTSHRTSVLPVSRPNLFPAFCIVLILQLATSKLSDQMTPTPHDTRTKAKTRVTENFVHTENNRTLYTTLYKNSQCLLQIGEGIGKN